MKKSLQNFTWPSLLLTLSISCFSVSATEVNSTLPPKLHAGDTVMLVSSGFRVENNQVYQNAKTRLQNLGLKVMTGEAVLTHDGYFAGNEADRARDINRAFADPKVNAIIEIRGGFGSTTILDQLDYALIKAHPKILLGFSDITALLLAIHEKTGLITFHGPMPGAFEWPSMTTSQFKNVLFVNQPALLLKNPDKNPIELIHGGTAQGILLGGNLTVLASLIGSDYLPKDWHNVILFVEDTHTDVYQIDRLLTQLKTAGILPQIKGFIFGTCTRCTRLIPGSPSMFEVVKSHIQALNIPSWYGAMIGHQSLIWTLPEGANVRINATQGSIQVLSPVVN